MLSSKAFFICLASVLSAAGMQCSLCPTANDLINVICSIVIHHMYYYKYYSESGKSQAFSGAYSKMSFFRSA